MREYQEKAIVQTVEKITEDIRRISFYAPLIAQSAKPGQFVMVKSGPTLDPLLRRPFSIHGIEAEVNVQLLFKILGKGTTLLGELEVGDEVDIIGPLGIGFNTSTQKRALLVGGGMGIAPLKFLAQKLQQGAELRHIVLLGARNKAELEPLVRDFQTLGCEVHAATDDGSYGHHGFVTELLAEALNNAGYAYVCGPERMMAAVARQCRAMKLPCQTSLETHMACGLGACLGCTIVGIDGDYRHVCKEGPVFNAQEVLWTV